MRRSLLAALVLSMAAVGLLALGAAADDGQGPADENATIADLNLGTYWFGVDVTKRDLRGKVVLVEVWGS